MYRCIYIHTYTHIYIYIMKNVLLPVRKRDGILSFVTTWVDLEGITFIEIRQRKTNTVCYHLYMESKK